MTSSDTKTRILDAAERSFADKGYAGASLREITAAAAANLAAANYHFGSKEGLALAVLERRLNGVNDERIARLNVLEARFQSAPCPLEELIRVFVAPAFELSQDKGADGAHMGRFFARLSADPGDIWKRVCERGIFDEVSQRFGQALALCLPELTREELNWRFHFLIGSMVHTLLHPETLITLSAGSSNPCDLEECLNQLVPFLTGALRAPTGASGAPSSKQDPS